MCLPGFTVYEVDWYLLGVVLFCFLDAMGKVGSRCSHARFFPNSEGLQQPEDVACQAWLLVSPGDYFFV